MTIRISDCGFEFPREGLVICIPLGLGSKEEVKQYFLEDCKTSYPFLDHQVVQEGAEAFFSSFDFFRYSEMFEIFLREKEIEASEYFDDDTDTESPRWYFHINTFTQAHLDSSEEWEEVWKEVWEEVLEEWEEVFQRLANSPCSAPLLSNEAISRESIYTREDEQV